MNKLQITKQLIDFFHSRPQTLIFEGYCKNAANVQVFAEGDSYALLATFADRVDCCIQSENMDFVLRFVNTLSGNVKFCGVSKQIIHYLQGRYSLLWRTDCFLYAWNGISLPYKCIGDLRNMDVAYAQQISDGTPYKADIDDVVDCVTNRPSSALYVDGEPVCWCLLHLENSLGMLYTLPQHRHKGYALEVMTDLCNKVIASGNVPYAYIIQDNLPSLNLAAKYNLVKVEERIYCQINFDFEENHD